MHKIIIILLLIGLFSCTEKLNIADFSDDFDSYKSELRIEAVLNANNFMNSIVRVDKTILITDTTLFNGIDDNGDGFIDDYNETLPFVHDSTMTSVILIESTTGNLIAEFEWNTKARIIENYFGEFEEESEPTDVYSYGGYIPLQEYFDISIVYFKEYEFQITTIDGDVITGSTIPLPPAELLIDDTNWDADTLIFNSAEDIINFSTNEAVSFGNFTFREIINNDSTIFSYSAFLPPSEYDKPGLSLYSLTRGFFPIGLSQLTVTIFNKDYSQYYISGLPLRDGSLSNLRDQNNKVVLGIAGSVANTKVYVNNIL